MTEAEWNVASRAKKNRLAEDAGLIRPSAFDRDLPCWHELPQLWKDRLAPPAPPQNESPP